MRALFRCPFAQDAWEVAHIVRHEDAFFARCERQHFLVLQSLQRGLLIERLNIMSAVRQAPSDPRPGHVCVKQQPHRGRLFGGWCDLQEGI